MLSAVNADGASGSTNHQILREGARRLLAALSEVEAHQYMAEWAAGA
ncbi:hypothetical protein [Streptomyces sp. HPF1205]|nr:hypothetical protein [Streptomyces sp. HPF1205]